MAQRNLANTTRALSRALERLSTGRRINSARDDASGLARATGLDSQTRSLSRAIKNANEAQAFLSTADGILASQLDLVHRMRELALQAANGTLALGDRSKLNLELNELLSEVDRLAKESTLNGSTLLDGTFSTLNIQVGSDKTDRIELSLGDSRAEALFTEENIQGLGTFDDPYTVTMLIPGVTVGATTKDLNNDGYDDLIHAQITNGYSVIRLNNGDGTFAAIQTYDMGIQATPSFVDLNDDGLLDMYAQNSSSSSFTYMLNQGDGTFGTRMSVNVGTGSSLYIRDMNSDGVNDLFGIDTSGRGRMWFNDGHGNFGARITSVGFTNAENIDFGDFNHDGYTDVVSLIDTAGDGTGYTENIHMSSGGTFSVSTTFGLGDLTTLTTGRITDMNGDGYSDLVRTSTDGTNIYTYLGGASGLASTAVTSAFGLSPVSDSYTQIVDINGDGIEDVLANISGGGIGVRLGTSAGSFTVGTTLSGLTGALILQADDLDGDGDIDVRGTTGSVTGIWKNNGSGTFNLAATSTITWGSLNVDLNGDGTLDAISSGSNVTQAILQSSDGSLHYSPSVDSTGFETNPTYGDFNGDGALDLMITHGSTFTSNGSVLIAEQLTQTSYDPATLSLETQADAQDALQIIDNAIASILDKRAMIGAQQSRLDSVTNTLSIGVENFASARSQILDADIAMETADLVRHQILQQAQISVSQQANLSLQAVLNLLRF